MVRYWIEWIDHGTNDRHSTDLHESLDEAMKAVPTWRAYQGSVKAYQVAQPTAGLQQGSGASVAVEKKTDDKVS